MTVPQRNEMTVNISAYEYFRWHENIPSFIQKELPIVYGLTGVVLNVILILYFIKSGKVKSPTFILLTNLAFLDVICCIALCGYSAFLFPIMVEQGSNFTCTLLHCIVIFGAFGSEYHLVYFAGLRLYQLAFPLFARARVTCRFVLKGCFIIHLLTLIYGLANGLFFIPKATVYNGKDEIICIFSGNGYAKDLAFQILGACIPCVSIFVLHFSKYIALARSKDKIFVQQERKNTDARAVTIVIVVFFIVWFTPNTYMLVMHAMVDNYDPVQDNLYILLIILTLSNSTINPLIYCFAAKSVRDDVVKLLCASRRAKRKNRGIIE